MDRVSKIKNKPEIIFTFQDDKGCTEVLLKDIKETLDFIVVTLFREDEK